MKKIKPINDQVLLKPLKEGQQMHGNLIIPDMGNEKPILAEVIETSEGIYNWNTGEIRPHEVKKGDIVVIPKLGALVMSLENEEYYLCQSQQLAATVYEEN